MAERRIEILVDTNTTAEKLISFLTSPAVTEMLTKAGGKIEGIANLDADSVTETSTNEELKTLLRLLEEYQQRHYPVDDGSSELSDLHSTMETVKFNLKELEENSDG